MDEFELKRHIEKFKSRGRYLFEAECSKTYSAIKLSDRHLALLLCDTAVNSGVTKYVRLFYCPDENSEELLFDSTSAN